MTVTPSPDPTVRERYWTETRIRSFSPAPPGWWIPNVWLDENDDLRVVEVPIVGWALTEDVPVRSYVGDDQRRDRSQWEVMRDRNYEGGPIELVDRHVEPVVVFPWGGGVGLASETYLMNLTFRDYVIPPDGELPDDARASIRARLLEDRTGRP